jgi:hypothetical protein
LVTGLGFCLKVGRSAQGDTDVADQARGRAEWTSDHGPGSSPRSSAVDPDRSAESRDGTAGGKHGQPGRVIGAQVRLYTSDHGQ